MPRRKNESYVSTLDNLLAETPLSALERADRRQSLVWALEINPELKQRYSPEELLATTPQERFQGSSIETLWLDRQTKQQDYDARTAAGQKASEKDSVFYGAVCESCGFEGPFSIQKDVVCRSLDEGTESFRVCPNCGAHSKM